MNENWLEIVSTLILHFENNTPEDAYQKEIESCLLILGWKKFNKTMLSQYTLPIGNSNNIRLDILLRKDNMDVLPIEVKRPSNSCTERQEKQLLSYMRQLRLNVGLYIGEKIHLYYDNPSDNSDAVCVFSAEIDPSDDNGAKLCDMLNYVNFDKEALESFCRKEYEKLLTRSDLHQRFLEYFSDAKGVTNVLSLIKDKFIGEGFSENAINEELEGLNITISFREKNYATDVPVVRSVNEYRVRTVRKSYESVVGYKALRITFEDGTVIQEKNAIDTERLFILKVGVERVKALGLIQNKEDLIGHPDKMRNPQKYRDRWTPLEKGFYLFNCSSSVAKIGHIRKIINALHIGAKVEMV